MTCPSACRQLVSKRVAKARPLAESLSRLPIRGQPPQVRTVHKAAVVLHLKAHGPKLDREFLCAARSDSYAVLPITGCYALRRARVRAAFLPARTRVA